MSIIPDLTSSNLPAARYQRQKIMQHTVQVSASLYTMNLGALSSAQCPLARYHNVNWNQQSDRREPHYQPSLVAEGSTYHASSVKHSITRLRPGALSPGGMGVDIKHNSYARRLNRLKGMMK